jgi:large subunit ribosomal protein L1
MPKHSKRYEQALAKVDRTKTYSLTEAVALARETASAKFNESVEVHIKLNADPTKGDQAVRGTLVMPHGTGNVPKVAVFAEGAAAEAATAAGADRVGGEDLVQAIDEGWGDFDILVAHPAMMRLVGRLGRKLGPRMPSKKSGNIAEDVGEVVRELKAGKVEYRMDRGSVMHLPVGKVSFTPEQLVENLTSLLSTINSVRPSSITGRFMKSVAVASSMGPGIKVDIDDPLVRAR